MFVSTKYRSNQSEIMDDLDMTGEVLIKTLDQLASINKWLGGNKITLDGVQSLLKNFSENRTIKIVDLGCGNGDMLRKVADFGRKYGFKFDLVGLDANQATINYAIDLSTNYPEITYRKQDVLSTEFKEQKYDIAMCTLFLHHFEDDLALDLIRNLSSNAAIGVIVNDLHRNKLAYYLFSALGPIIKNHMVQTDGLISILRGFKRVDLRKYATKIKYKSTINWRWAFRYQWIITKK